MIRNKEKFNRAILEMVNTVNGKNLSISLFFISFVALVPAIRAHIADFDEYWQQRALEAKNNTLNVYHPNPEEVTNEFNLEVHRAISGIRISNTTRRLSGGHKKHIGPCLATNPIDKCWRCDPLWAQNRKKLADCVLGFGRNTRGGKFGSYYVVTDASDNDMANPRPGTLRHAVTRHRPLWIYFARSMIIRLNQELIVAGDKTIDARGANVRIVGGAGITVQFVNNVIIHGLHIHHIVKGNGGMIMDKEDHVGLRTHSDGDGISIFGSTNIWIDHISISKCDDGSIDATEGSTGITISNCHFTHHVKVMLLGASGMSTQDKMMQVTVAFNHFGKELKERMPRVRWGFVHVVNNDYTHWMGYAIGGSHQPTIISQGNRFIAPNDPRAKEVTKREYVAESVWRSWLWKSEGDIMMNGAFFVTSGNPNQALWFSSLDIIKAELGKHVGHLTRFAGSVDCFVGKPC